MSRSRLTRPLFAAVALLITFTTSIPAAIAEGGFGSADGSFSKWQQNTKDAVAAQGSSCPWRYTGIWYPVGVEGGVIQDSKDPGSGRWIRVFEDCNRTIRLVIEPTPGELAEMLYARVIARVPLPVPGIKPTTGGWATVKVDNWVWLTNGQPITVTGALLGINATVVAQPSTLTTDWGDGTTTTCNAPGLSFDDVKHPNALKDRDPQPGGCGHRYTEHSGKQPDKKYTVTTTVTWTATWTTTNGFNGTFDPLTRTNTTQLPVNQIQTINIPNPKK